MFRVILKHTKEKHGLLFDVDDSQRFQVSF